MTRDTADKDHVVVKMLASEHTSDMLRNILFLQADVLAAFVV